MDGKELLGDTHFYNRAYVIGSNGVIVHQQVKSVPIQSFREMQSVPPIDLSETAR